MGMRAGPRGRNEMCVSSRISTMQFGRTVFRQTCPRRSSGSALLTGYQCRSLLRVQSWVGRSPEEARRLGAGFECRVRLPDGSLEEVVISATAARSSCAPPASTPPERRTAGEQNVAKLLATILPGEPVTRGALVAIRSSLPRRPPTGSPWRKSGAGSVPLLAVANRADRPLPLLDGEELIGAKQNRCWWRPTEVTSPMSCGERGAGAAAAAGSAAAPRRPRALRSRLAPPVDFLCRRFDTPRGQGLVPATGWTPGSVLSAQAEGRAGSRGMLPRYPLALASVPVIVRGQAAHLHGVPGGRGHRRVVGHQGACGQINKDTWTLGELCLRAIISYVPRGIQLARQWQRLQMIQHPAVVAVETCRPSRNTV